MASNLLRNFETAYVVKFHAVNILDTPQSCFEFVHPSRDDHDCTRHKVRQKLNSLFSKKNLDYEV